MEHTFFGKNFIQFNDDCAICQSMERCQKNTNPDFIYHLNYSIVTLGKKQFYKGYSIVMFNSHKTELFELTREERSGYFDDISIVAQAISNLYHPDKLNYEILGNQEPHLHCHVFPRKRIDEFFRTSVWARPEDKSPKINFTPMELEATVMSLRKEIDKLLGKI